MARWNKTWRDRHGRTPPKLRIETRDFPRPEARATGVERRSPRPCGLKPARRRRQDGLPRCARIGCWLQDSRIGKALGEQKTAQAQTPVRDSLRGPERDRGGTNAQDHQPLRCSEGGKLPQDIVAAADATVLDMPQNHIDETLPQMRLTRHAITVESGGFLHKPGRVPNKTAPFRSARIRPAEPRIEKILDGLPDRAARRSGRVDVETPDLSVGAGDPARNEHVDFEPPDMRVRRHEDRWSRNLWHARKGNFEKQRKGEIHSAARLGITSVEVRDIDVFGGEGKHGRAVLQRAGGGADGRTRQCGIPHEDFGDGVTPYKQAATWYGFEGAFRRHVTHAVLRRVPFRISRMF